MTSSRGQDQLQPVAALMAAILPGLGYVWFGELKRAVLVFVGVMGLFAGGMLIGGIDVIDRREDRWWFLLQAGVGPTAFIVDSVHQSVFKIDMSGQRVSAPPDHPAFLTQRPAPSVKSVGRVNEAGTLMASLAGMMNLIAFIDCLWHPARGRQRRAADPVTLRVGATPAQGNA
jgi:hypothetical protein